MGSLCGALHLNPVQELSADNDKEHRHDNRKKRADYGIRFAKWDIFFTQAFVDY